MDDYNLTALFYGARQQHQGQLMLQREFDRLHSGYAQQAIAEQSPAIQGVESPYESHGASKFLPHQVLPIPHYRGPYELLRWPAQHVADEPGYASDIQRLPKTEKSPPWHCRVSRGSLEERSDEVQATTSAVGDR